MTRDDLLRAVVDAPADDLPRLAFADYLDDTGEDPDRAAFIRLDVEAGRFPLDHPNRAAADRAARALYLENWSRWAAELPANFADHGRPSFYRGFAEEVVVEASWFADHANELLTAAPIHAVTLRPPAPLDRPYALFGGKAELHRLRTLTFENATLVAELDVGVINGGGTWLAVPTTLDDLLSCPTLTGLQHLHLGFNPLGPASGLALARRLPAAAFAQTLLEFDASACGLGAEGHAALTAMTPLPNLTVLRTGYTPPAERPDSEYAHWFRHRLRPAAGEAE